jgi:hypothetical protein
MGWRAWRLPAFLLAELNPWGLKSMTYGTILEVVHRGRNSMARFRLSMVVWISFLSLSCSITLDDSHNPAARGGGFQDDFQSGQLNTIRWSRTQEGDFKEATIDVVDVDPGEKTDDRLRLRANTLGTRDDTVKFLGVRSIDRIDFAQGVEVSLDLDWNKQANGCYLTAAVYLCPTITSANPRDEADWFKFQYVGVPPGKNARSVVAKKVNGRVQYLDRDGWPQNRRARMIANQHIDIYIDGHGLQIKENGQKLYGTSFHELSFDQAYLYLQMSSHSNYPSREIYFDNIIVSNDCTGLTKLDKGIAQDDDP